jgi:hypothetical protein
MITKSSANLTGLDLAKPIERSLASFGHLADRFLFVRQVLLRRAAKPGTFDELKGWLKGLHVETSLPLADEGHFQSRFLLEHNTLRVLSLVESVSPEHLETGRKGLSIPFEANASLWPALLRLRPLREFWERELGRSHWETLCLLLPDAWVVTPTLLPPGAVIPRLNLATWDDYDQLAASGQRHLISLATETASAGKPACKETIQEALAATGETLSILTEDLSLREKATEIIAVYHRAGKRTELVSLLKP